MIIEHCPYVGTNYSEGIGGLRVGVVGYSHYVSDHTQDSSNFTVECVQKLLKSEWARDPIFFRLITKAFGFADGRDFWRRILFFNWAPHSMGGHDEKFDTITPDQEARAAVRLGEVLDTYTPDVVVIFTTKARLGLLGLEFTPMAPPLTRFLAGRRTTAHADTRIYRLRHTQGAKAAELGLAVSQALSQA